MRNYYTYTNRMYPAWRRAIARQKFYQEFDSKHSRRKRIKILQIKKIKTS